MLEMLKRVEYNLCCEIEELMGPSHKKHGRHLSGESDSGVSVASAVSRSTVADGFPEINEI
jgi:hypothetical protein